MLACERAYGQGMTVGTIAALWRFPVKSMGGEEIESSVVDFRALHADRLWAVRDLELNAVTTARRLADAARLFGEVRGGTSGRAWGPGT